MDKKKLSFCCTLLIIFSVGLFRSNIAVAQYMPSFNMRLTNGKLFSAKDLSHQIPVIIIYFAPDCGHCLTLMDSLFKKIRNFKKAQIVMVTFKPLDEVTAFEKTYHTVRYQNIKVGIETPVFFFRDYYKVDNTPFTALYNRHGKLIIAYRNKTPVDDLIRHLHVL